MAQPAISVIFPFFNAEKYIEEALVSILAQTFSDFELIAIYDDSNDKSLEIISSFYDRRIKIFRNNITSGLIACLNKALNLAGGKYIARMDADDISLPTRFEKQVKLLDENPEIGVCSTWIEFFGETNEIAKFPENHDEIYLKFLLGVQVGHANSMIRANIINHHNIRYDPDFIYSEDTNLWVRLLEYTTFANIPEVLYMYRKYNDQITMRYSDLVKDSFNRSINIHFKNILRKLQMDEHNNFILFPSLTTLEQIFEYEKVASIAFKKNKKLKIFNECIFRNVLMQIWKNKYRKLDKNRIQLIKEIVFSDFPNNIDLNVIYKINFLTHF